MLSTILLRWWKSPLKKLPQEGKMKREEKRKPPQIPWLYFMPVLRHIHCATAPAQPSPSQEVKPSQGIVWLGSLFTTQIASTIPALGSRKAPGQKAEKLGEDFEDLLQPSPTNWCRKGKGSLAFAWVDSLGVRGVPSAGVEGRWPFAPGLRIEKALPRRGASSSGHGFPARSGCQVRPSVPNPRGTINDSPQAPGETGLPPDRRDQGAGLGPEPHRARPRPTWGGPGGVAKGHSREPRDGAARRRRRLVSPGQSSAAVSRPQTPSGATGTAPLAAAEAATGPPPPPPTASSSLLPPPPPHHGGGPGGSQT